MPNKKVDDKGAVKDNTDKSGLPTLVNILTGGVVNNSVDNQITPGVKDIKDGFDAIEKASEAVPIFNPAPSPSPSPGAGPGGGPAQQGVLGDHGASVEPG